MNTFKTKDHGQIKTFLIGPLALLAVFFTIIKSSGYSYLAPEVFLALAATIMLGVALGLIIVLSPSLLRLGVYSCLIAAVSNALFRPFPTIEWLPKDEWAYSLAIFCVSLVVLWVLRRISDELLFVVFFVLLLSSFFIPDRPAAWKWEINDTNIDHETNLPPYIHIVLDAHIGLEDVPKDLDPNETFKSSIANPYVDLGFKVYGKVTVPYFPQTILSFRNFLNFIHEPKSENMAKLKDQGHNFLEGTNEIFSSLHSMGYSINVIQTSHLDLCHNSKAELIVETCRTYPFSYLLDNLMGSSLGATEKATIMVNRLFRRAGIGKVVDTIADSSFGQKIDFPRWPVNVCLNCISTFTALNEFNEKIGEIKRGEAYFIHLLAPHGPYNFYNEECGLIFPLKFQASTITNNFSKYFGQATCTQQRLRETLVKLFENEATREAVIIIHGDHGPDTYYLNIKSVPYDAHSKEYGQAAYSTFFAARAAGLAPGYDPNPYILPALLEEVFNSNVINQNTR